MCAGQNIQHSGLSNSRKYQLRGCQKDDLIIYYFSEFNLFFRQVHISVSFQLGENVISVRISGRSQSLTSPHPGIGRCSKMGVRSILGA